MGVGVGLVASCEGSLGSEDVGMGGSDGATGTMGEGDVVAEADSDGSGSGGVVADVGRLDDCDLDPARLDRSQNGYPAGPYGVLPGDRFASAASSSLTDCGGVPADFRELFAGCNRAVLVSIHAAWSGSSRADRTDLAAVHAEYGPAGFEMVHVLVEDSVGGPASADACVLWRKGGGEDALEPLGLPPPVFIDPPGTWLAEHVQQPTAQVPMHFLLDANANIRRKWVGSRIDPDELRLWLDVVRQGPYEEDR